VTKTSAYRVQTFQSVDLGMLGVADPDVVKFFNEPTRRHTFGSEFNIATLPEELPAVEALYAYSDAPGYLVDTLVEHGVRGIVIDGVGAGSLGSFADAAEAAQKQGVVVVATARTFGGRVQDTPRRHESGVVPGDNLPPEKAKILLQLALAKTGDIDELRRIFNEY
jgi:L-asparaginase